MVPGGSPGPSQGRSRTALGPVLDRPGIERAAPPARLPRDGEVSRSVDQLDDEDAVVEAGAGRVADGAHVVRRGAPHDAGLEVARDRAFVTAATLGGAHDVEQGPPAEATDVVRSIVAVRVSRSGRADDRHGDILTSQRG